MKKLLLIFIFELLIFNVLFSTEPPREPFVVLRINGKEYQPESEIEVRPGERLSVVAVMMGGKRDYCSDPHKYANVGQTTTITYQGENGMSFYIGDGTFRGSWSLQSEIATFKSADEVKITPVSQSETIKNEAVIEIPKSGVSKVYLKVTVKTSWKYEKNTQAGYSEDSEENEGTSTFYFVIVQEEGVWYSSANLSAKGEENFSVRNSLDYVQKSYDDIYNKIKNKDFKNLEMYVNNLKTTISTLKKTIDDEKKKNKKFQCDVTFIGLPTSLTMNHLKNFEILSAKWFEMYMIAQSNVSKINEMLLDVQMGLSSNVLKSVFKNYINWGTSIPTSAPDFLVLYDPNSTLTAVSLPAKVMEWWEEANNDASILQNQVQTIKMLSELRKFYLDRMTQSVEERKQIELLIDELQPVKNLHEELKIYFASIGWANVKI